MARRKVIFATVVLFSCFGLLTLFLELSVLDIYTFWPKRFVIHTFNFDEENKTFLLLPKADCKKNPPFLVLLITTIHSQKDARMAIRYSWGKERRIRGHRVVAYFLLGTSETQSTQEEASLIEENNVYHDIIQRNFIDVYYNLTIKTRMGIDWIYHHCPETNFVMKTDADMFINIYHLVSLLLEKHQTSNFFTGFLKPNDNPIRNVFSKYYVSRKEYPWEKYPPFCSGTGYLFSVDVALKVHNISDSVPFFKLEDVYIGLCLKKLKIPLQELDTAQTFFPEKKPFSVCNYRYIVSSHGVQPHEIALYWEALQRSGGEKCKDDNNNDKTNSILHYLW
ncbi:beta-1,3-galactosyltransferase 5 [Rhinophrynus dorsalis]